MTSDLWDGPIAIAHRGSRLLWPENTMEAFSGAVGSGVRHLETDLRISSDGVLVCFHDDLVDRTTDGSGPVVGHTWAELASLDAGHNHDAAGGFPYRGTGSRVPRLEEVVTAFPDVGLVVDLKVEGTAVALAGMVEEHDLHDRLIVGSFSDRRLAEFREATGGRVATSVGQAAARRWLIASRMRRPARGQASALQVPLRSRGVVVVDERLVSVAHDAGLDVHVWTVNRVGDMRRLLDMGVDGVISDRPDLVGAVIEEGGQV
jgi:glycerophosphoryl diester phosphodiesterase